MRSVRYGGSVLTRFYLLAMFFNHTQQSVIRASIIRQYLSVMNHVPSEVLPMINGLLRKGNGRFISLRSPDTPRHIATRVDSNHHCTPLVLLRRPRTYEYAKKNRNKRELFFLGQLREEGYPGQELRSAILIAVCPTICPTFLTLSAGKRREDRKISRKIASLPSCEG
jgi:hypothetical protein